MAYPSYDIRYRSALARCFGPCPGDVCPADLAGRAAERLALRLDGMLTLPTFAQAIAQVRLSPRSSLPWQVLGVRGRSRTTAAAFVNFPHP